MLFVVVVVIVVIGRKREKALEGKGVTNTAKAERRGEERSHAKGREGKIRSLRRPSGKGRK